MSFLAPSRAGVTARRGAPSARAVWSAVGLLLAIGLGMGVLDAGGTSVYEGARQGGSAAIEPIASAGAQARWGITAWWESLRDAHSLHEENERLRLALAQAMVRSAARDARQSIGDARARVGTMLPANTDLIDAPVLGMPSGLGRLSLWIGVGANRGLRPGMVVLGPTGLVGSVDRVFDSSALVILAGDTRSRWGGLGLDSGEAAPVVGAGDARTAHVLLEREQEQLHPGEQVVTTGMAGSAAPGGLPIGTVREIGRNKQGETVAIVDLAEDAFALRTVFVLPSRRLEENPPRRRR